MFIVRFMFIHIGPAALKTFTRLKVAISLNPLKASAPSEENNYK